MKGIAERPKIDFMPFQIPAVVTTVAEHWDQFSDVTTISLAHACDEDVTPSFVKSFKAATLENILVLNWIPEVDKALPAWLESNRVWYALVLV